MENVNVFIMVYNIIQITISSKIILVLATDIAERKVGKREREREREG